jgi:RNA polymerase sigma-70 factor (ECF subfamily)
MTRSDSQKRSDFELLVLPLMGPLYRTALRLTRQPDDASDVVQESYLRAYRTFENFRQGTDARAWMFTILYSVFINRHKKSRRDEANVSIEDLEAKYWRFLADPGRGPGEVELGDMDSPEVEAALDALPETFRSAVLMVDVNELSYEEAAAALRCPVGTLRSRLFRGRRLLFAALRDYARRSGYMRSKDA